MRRRHLPHTRLRADLVAHERMEILKCLRARGERMKDLMARTENTLLKRYYEADVKINERLIARVEDPEAVELWTGDEVLWVRSACLEVGNVPGIAAMERAYGGEEVRDG